MKEGDSIITIYGQGVLDSYRETDAIYKVQLPYGQLYANAHSIIKDVTSGNNDIQKKQEQLNLAFENLEQMRRMNLELTCQERNIQVDYETCTVCLLQHPDPVPTSARFGRRLQQQQQPKKLKGQPCLICGASTCKQHSSKLFADKTSSYIIVCVECERIMQPEYVVSVLTSTTQRDRQAKLDMLMDRYDRSTLLLQFSMQYVDSLITALQNSAKRTNRVGLGSSASGMVSGILGVAAACTMLTPAGPPLLLTSLLLSGTATAAQTGTSMRQNYFSEPHKLANRILVLNGIIKALLGVLSTLRDAITRDIIRTDFYQGVPDLLESSVVTVDEQQIRLEQELMASMSVGRYTAASVEMGVAARQAGTVASRSARFFSRAGTSGLTNVVRFVRFAGGALSAATLVLEAHSLGATVEKIRAGDPCEKAEFIQKVQSELADVPTTAQIDKECSTYLQLLTRRQRQMTEEEAVRLLLDEFQDDSLLLSEEAREQPRPKQDLSVSLLQRIERHKQMQHKEAVDK